MKKLITLTITFMLLVTNIAYGETIKLSDIQNHWAKDAVEHLISLGVINGYDDGTFKPEDNVNVDAFIKMAVTSLGHKLENGKLYWASTFINKAKELDLVKDGEYINCMRAITRAEMARIIVRALDEEYPANIDEYKSLITDYNSIEDTYKEDIVKAYCKGIITGYDDGSFKPKKNATRAEAATMIVRMLEESKRKVPDLSQPIPNKEEEIPPIKFEVIDSAEFQNLRKSEKKWFGVFLVRDRTYEEMKEQGWQINVVYLDPEELNTHEYFNHGSGKWCILELKDDEWGRIEGSSFSDAYRLFIPLRSLGFDVYGTREYRATHKFKEGDVVTVRARARRKLEDGTYKVYEQVFKVKLVDRTKEE